MIVPQRTPTESLPVLSLADVDAGYSDLQILSEVSIEVRDHSVVALFGPNGAGKTTLLRYASGLIGGWRGRLRVNGKDVTGQSAAKIASSGLCHVPEGSGVYPSLTVRENILLNCPGIKRADLIGDALATFPALSSKLNQPAGTLSGGEQKMLALSRAFSSKATVVLLDEVSMGLAPKVVDEIFGAIERLRDRQVSLLFVEQYVDRALAIADYVYVLNRGRIQSHGKVSEFSRDRVVSSYLGV